MDGFPLSDITLKTRSKMKLTRKKILWQSFNRKKGSSEDDGEDSEYALKSVIELMYQDQDP